MDFTSTSEIGKEYNGFVVVNVEDIPDHKGKAVYLRHKTTGLEVFHLQNEDKENLFSFCFRTVAKNSKGAAHITEHSVLCGSEKFPLKEPFNTLDQQSLKTFLNAMTYPEKTLYPAASVVKSDYFNLMDVYADAVFFPKLSKQTFMQEGWRVELDEKGKASIQGVVYNEMKANYSTFTQVAVNKMLSAMYPDSIIDYDSGGDPLEIPALTYEEFVAFHKKFYSPSNCLVFLYGDISTKEQLDFLNEKYMNRLETTYGKIENLDLTSQIPYVDSEIQTIQTYKRIPENQTINDIAPDNGATGNMVSIGYYLGPNNIEHTLLSEILIGNDSSPMTVKLKDSKLGEDEAPVNGNCGYVQNDCVFCFGLSGVKKGNDEKVYSLIEKSLQEIYDEGISENDINSAIMSIDFNLREENRVFGPPSISIMSRAASSWSIGERPSKLLNRISDFEIIKNKIKENPEYPREMIKKYFLDAEVSLKCSIKPSKKYFQKRKIQEEEKLKLLEKNIDKDLLQKELNALHEYQNKLETEEELKCIPHLSVQELAPVSIDIPTEFKAIKTKNEEEIPVLINRQNTNGIVYFNVFYPFDNLAPEDYKYISLFSAFIDNLGRKNKDWKECIAEEAAVFGEFGVKLQLSSERDVQDAKKVIETYKNKNFVYRDYIGITTKFVSDVTEKALDIIAECISSSVFEDVDHAETLFNEEMNDLTQNFISNAMKYINLYSKHQNSKSFAVRELIYGISNFFNCKNYTLKDVPELLKQFTRLFEEIRKEGAVIHIICDDANYEKITALLPDFISKANLQAIKAKKAYSMEDYLKLVYKPADYDENSVTFIQAPAQAGYTSFSSKCSGELTKEAIAEQVLANYVSGHQLWEKIRMQGGAYGGKCGVDPREKLFSMMSWRDPTPQKSLKAFEEILDEVCSFEFSKEDVDRCILSEYSEYIVPDSPAGYGTRGFTRYITGYTEDQYRKEVELLLSITPQDVHQAAVRLRNFVKESHHGVVFCDISEKCCGNIIKTPL